MSERQLFGGGTGGTDRCWLDRSGLFDEGDEITWGVSRGQCTQVWTLGYNGAGVLVGILDTGVNYNHLDLTTHMWNGGVTYPFHGYISTIRQQSQDDGLWGMGRTWPVRSLHKRRSGTQAGVAPAAIIMAIKVWSGGGSGTTATMIAGINSRCSRTAPSVQHVRRQFAADPQ